MGRDQTSEGVRVPCRHATPVANVLLKPLIHVIWSKVEFGKKVTNGNKVWSCKCVQVPRKPVKPMLLYQETDVIPLANTCIFVRCFVRRNYYKVLMETGKFSDNLNVTKKWTRVCLLTECLNRRILCFRTSAIDLIHSEGFFQTSDWNHPSACH